ncbi:hypothetical protein BS47DRAFT_1454752 [Hydnum rufescens UP504]|uniref:Kinase-like protein n=1 Tax=Hydnum rufescens UP504 TaxID=1448309 RepID=A0A9P6DXN9_9AGAM|nr:hypothetical protein BS47DRAFT_1454752 [Hydnum rufescens UP504]
MSLGFDVIPFEEIKGKWEKLGKGGFGEVSKGVHSSLGHISVQVIHHEYPAKYLGIDVAVKEILRSKTYDFQKYFDREWSLMREARHPNVVLYMALSHGPPPDNRVFIISEFIENGNLREYIWDKTKPLPWHLRLSFATDATRAMAYLHARQCVHRDLKPENLLLTANGRLKVTDFGFARILAQNEDDAKRQTTCGTDLYMSPEIARGEKFGLETDVFSLGVIFCELLSRKLAFKDSYFQRTAPWYAMDRDEVRMLAPFDCPPDFLSLALDCCTWDPAGRPTMVQILDRLRKIETAVVNRAPQEEPHVGSIKFLSANKRKHGISSPGGHHRGSRHNLATRRIPSFGMGVRVGRVAVESPHPDTEDVSVPGVLEDPSEDEEDEELEAILARNGFNLKVPDEDHGSDGGSWRLEGWMKEYADRVPPPGSSAFATDHEHRLQGSESLLLQAPLLSGSGYADMSELLGSDDSTSVTSSTQTVRPSPTQPIKIQIDTRARHQREPNMAPSPDSEFASEASYFTATTPSQLPTEHSAAADSAARWPAPNKQLLTHPETKIRDGDFALETPPMPSGPDATPHFVALPPRLHRFSLVKSGGAKKQLATSVFGTAAPPAATGGWSPLDIFFGNGWDLGARCDICTKRLGWKPVLECDDCGLKTHMKCGETAPMDCEAREVANAKIELRTASPKENRIFTWVSGKQRM